MPVIVPKQAFTATPVSTRRAVESRFGLESIRPSRNTVPAAKPEPASANHSCTKGEDTPKMPTPTTTATAAPEFTPSSPGSASGLRESACMITPATASAAPTIIAASVRGIRLNQISFDSIVAASGCRKPSSAFSKENMRELTAPESTIRTAKRASPIRSARPQRDSEGFGVLDRSGGATVVLWADAPAPSDLEATGCLPRWGDELIGVLYLVVIGRLCVVGSYVDLLPENLGGSRIIFRTYLCDLSYVNMGLIWCYLFYKGILSLWLILVHPKTGTLTVH